MTWPVLSLRAALDSDPLDDTPTWTTLTTKANGEPRLLSLSVDVGGDGDEFGPSSASVGVDNPDRSLDPQNAAGAYFGKLTPQKRVNVQFTHPDYTGTGNLCTFFVEDYPTAWREPSVGEAVLAGSDGFSLLANHDVTEVYAAEVLADGPVVRYRFDDDVDAGVAADSSGNRYDGVFEGEVESVDPLVVGEGGAVFFGNNGRVSSIPLTVGPTALPWSVEAWVNTTVAPVPSTRAPIYSQDPFVTFTWLAIRNGGLVEFYSGGTKVESTVAVNDGLPHHIVGVAPSGNMKIYVDGVDVTASVVAAVAPTRDTGVYVGVGSAGGSSFVDFDGVMDEVAVYHSALSGARALAHYQAGSEPWTGDTTGERVERYLDVLPWPASLRDIDTGETTLGPALNEGNVLDLSQKAVRTEQGWFWANPDGTLVHHDRHSLFTDSRSVNSQATFTDDPAAPGTDYRFEELILEPASIRQVRNIVSVDWDGGTETVRDQASIDGYGPKTYSLDTMAKSVQDARDIGEWQLLQYAEPATRIRGVILDPAADQRLFKVILNMRVGDRWTFRRHPLSKNSAWTEDAYVTGWHHDINDGVNTWTTRVLLTPVEQFEPFVLNTSQLGAGTLVY